MGIMIKEFQLWKGEPGAKGMAVNRYISHQSPYTLRSTGGGCAEKWWKYCIALFIKDYL
jgi:hypothetical protein